MRKTILYVIVGLAVAAILYFIWDMFIKSPEPEPFGNTRTDTVNVNRNDSTQQVDTARQHAVVKTNEDTLWVEYTIKSGDVLSVVAEKFNLSKERLMKKNKLAKDIVQKGDKLWVPVKAQHQVAGGETVGGIATKYKSRTDAILKANGLKSATDLRSGVTIYIPY
jgi:LysM repeat protein